VNCKPRNRLWWATLDRRSPRYADWEKILGSDDVPLQSPASGQTKLGQESAEVYLLDLAQLSAEQRAHLIEFIVQRFKADRREVEQELDKVGFPIRAADVSVAFSLRAFI
jgi:hypothetical protein